MHFPLVRNGTAAAAAGSGAVPGFKPAAAAAEEWRGEAARRFGDGAALRAEGKTRLAVSAEPAVLSVRLATDIELLSIQGAK